MSTLHTNLRFAPARVEVEAREGRSRILRSPIPLAPFPRAVGEWLVHWARTSPDRVFLAERAGEAWRKVTYAGALDAVRSIGEALLARGLSADRPAAILWLVIFHPELSDDAVGKLVGTTKPTIQAIRERSHWNINNITPIDPVALGLCKQSELDAIVQVAARKKAADSTVMSDDDRRKLVSTEQSLAMATEARNAPQVAVFVEEPEDKRTAADFSDAESFFNLPQGDDEDDDDEN